MSEQPTAKLIGSILDERWMKTHLPIGNCEAHGDYHGLSCPKCEIQHSVTNAQVEAERARREAALKALVYRSGIPPRFMTKTFDSFQTDTEQQARVLRICRAYADRFDDRLAAGGGLVMCGLPGTGKTHLACAIGSALMQRGRSVLFINVISAVDRVMETFRREKAETKRQAIARFFEADLLILDEVGLQFGNDSEKVILFEIINGRYDRVLPTILISNLQENELGAYIGDRLIDRMREGGGVVLAFDWPSKRKEIKTASKDMPAWVQAATKNPGQAGAG